ncbi:MAG: hypothetical protein K2G85_06145 [Muribaculaceae bacterium]|nr:hypothetical protein [Muribaculaceae bacterium]
MMHSNNTVFLFLAATIFSLTGCGKDSDFSGDNATCPEEISTVYSTPSYVPTSRYATCVFDYTPAPGQFINDPTSGGMPADLSDPTAAAEWAQSRLEKKLFVSLGSFGGYITVGFDHEVKNSNGDYDFAIFGNAFFGATGSGGSNEPGIVYVMEDTNTNGLPDDTWYELRGSDYYQPSTIHDYSVTYFRPASPAMPVEWHDNLGNSGSIAYLKAFHKQDYYYPAWIKEDSYTLSGTKLPARTETDPETGLISNNPYAWGYADNMGEDNIALDGMPQANRFRIADAVNSEGNTVKLRSISFVKVQTAILNNAGILGEVSTEVFGFYDLMTNPDDTAVPMIHN